MSDEDIQSEERRLIQELNTLQDGYNSTPGGDGGAGKTLTPEHKVKLSQAFRGSNNPQFGKYGPDHPAYGNRHTEEAKQKIRAAHLGRPKSQQHRKALSQAKKLSSRFTQQDYQTMVQLRQDGLTYREIGERFDASPSVVCKIVKRESHE